MADIVVLGAGVCGLAFAALLAEDGHDVVVLERDRAELPASGSEAWQDWSRHGVAQFRGPTLAASRADGRYSSPSSRRCGTPWPKRMV